MPGIPLQCSYTAANAESVNAIKYQAREKRRPFVDSPPSPSVIKIEPPSSMKPLSASTSFCVNFDRGPTIATTLAALSDAGVTSSCWLVIEGRYEEGGDKEAMLGSILGMVRRVARTAADCSPGEWCAAPGVRFAAWCAAARACTSVTQVIDRAGGRVRS